MPGFAFPPGQYLAVTSRLALGRGGQTAMFLLRNRLFAEQAGITPTLLSFDDQPDYPHIRAELAAAGQIAPSTVILNLFEWLRNEPPPLAPDQAPPLPDPVDLDRTDQPHPDGTVHLSSYSKGTAVMTDYRRADGSVYLRRSSQGLLLADRNNRVVRRFGGLGALRRWWVTGLFDPDPSTPVFVVSDSRFALRHLVPLAHQEQVRLIHVVHNIHVLEPYHPDSEPHPTHLPVLEAIPQLSALVTLTERQREDIVRRFDTADNVYVIPNPVTEPSVGDEKARQAQRFVMIGRLERQKQIEDAVRAFATVVAEEPGATLDIYGEGSLREELQNQLRTSGLEHAVRLRGYDAAAKEQLHTATALLLTSRFEGYPLVVLEALARGCPVIAYDIAYGPREQMRSAGFLVRPGDTGELADQMLRLVRDPDLLARLSTAARAEAGTHSVQQYLRDWQTLLHRVASEEHGQEGDDDQGADDADGDRAEAAEAVGEEEEHD
ncbi:hypothetical protein Kisp01_65100 [Kineosporia sp. NBRC 101677]|nr:glycosyltransferase [Kineosporia sp. NBRC 101677]GLY19496.1 hypothetical protein Kisp01_65100 [Kineosporia sp. NBRC 101677]